MGLGVVRWCFTCLGGCLYDVVWVFDCGCWLDVWSLLLLVVLLAWCVSLVAGVGLFYCWLRVTWVLIVWYFCEFLFVGF